MNQTYFLGANSKDGFVSLYGYFPRPEGDFLHIVKGGPGTGKSSFMRCIGRAAEARGLETHYVLCSGDPKSLDGVYVPQWRRAWVDGTAPHASEPRCFGVDADYVNLGQFCHTPFSAADAARARELTRRYRKEYAMAYRLLGEGRIVEEGGAGLSDPEELLEGLDEAAARPAYPERRFLHAISCEGEQMLSGEIKQLCPDCRAVPSETLAVLSRELERRRLPAVRCPSPFDASRLEAVLLPWSGRGFVAAWKLRGLSPALDMLREAKELHDELESISKQYMDFSALQSFTEQSVERIIRECEAREQGSTRRA